MRGALVIPFVFISRLGIIPAYAGSTAFERHNRGPSKDHPRVCGEHLSRAISVDLLPGSSPRMRGARCMTARLVPSGRIIPAYAGSTWPRSGRRRKTKDHPRVCGEHISILGKACDFEGSSPRMRGAQRPRVRTEHPPGIIPAYAGSTLKDPCNPNNMIDKISDF